MSSRADRAPRSDEPTRELPLRRCCCPVLVTRRECVAIRYHSNEFDEECECVCHDEYDEDEHDFYREQAL